MAEAGQLTKCDVPFRVKNDYEGWLQMKPKHKFPTWDYYKN